jgi:putative endonuclease
MTSKRTSKQETGQRGEDVALTYLQKKGYVVLERNFRSPFGEVDIVARDKDTLVFVEVRTGGRGRIHDPEETVGPRKQLRIGRTALFYMKRHRLEDQWAARFDVVAVEEGEKGLEVRHIEDAFEFEGG